MNNLIVFDSDFIIANIKSLKEFLDSFNDYQCYVCHISLREIAKYNSLGKLKIINDFKDKIKQYKSLGIKFENSDEKVMELIEKDSEKYVKDLFKNNVIMNHDRTINGLLDRAYNKVPPFNESDKGFKDTLILLDVIDFIKGKNVKKAYFVTNDKDFVKEKSSIEFEVNNKTKSEFCVVDGKNPEKLLNYFQVGNTEKINDLSDDLKIEESIDVEKFRNDLNSICFDLFHYKEYNPNYMCGEYIGDNFIVVGELSKKEIEKFLDDLQKNIDKYIFNSNVMMSDFFDNPFIFNKEISIDISVFEKLNKSYSQVKDTKKYKEAFLNLISINFDKLNKKDDEELPF